MQKANAVKRIVAEMTLVRMCDPALDTSNQALLSRIARLEEAIASGVSVASSAPPKEKPAKAKAEPKASKSEESKLACEQPKPQAVEKAPVTPTQTAVSDKARTLRPVRVWNEVVSRIAEGHPVPASFFKTAKAYSTEDGKIIIKFAEEFQKMMAERDGGVDAVRGALSFCLQKQLTPTDISLEVQASDKTEDSLIDLILEAADEQ